MSAATKMSSEAFMNYLAELQNKYIERVSQELVAYFQNEPVAILSRLHVGSSFKDKEEYMVSRAALVSAVAAMPPHRFSDGVEVDMSRYLLSAMNPAQMVTTENTNFHITLLRARKRADKLILVELNDTRLNNKFGRSFSELISVPHSFYDFLRHNVCVNDTWMRYAYFKECVCSKLRSGTSEAVRIFDRAAKLRALQQVLAS